MPSVANHSWKAMLTLLSLLLGGCASVPNSRYHRLGRSLMPSIILESGEDQRFAVRDRLAFHKVPAASVALIKHNRVVWRAQWSSRGNIRDETMFQVASVSKPITAIGVLRLVEKRGLDIDADVNTFLKSWKVDYAQFGGKEKVTIRRLLSHKAGLNLGGFRGYQRDKAAFTVTEVLAGRGTTTPALSLARTPGSAFSYSGGGYVLLQQLVEDVSGQSFPEYMREQVFEPLKMRRSTFDQEPSGNLALAHDKEGVQRTSGWLVFPELAAAGLWSTPADLAKALIAVHQAAQGAEGGIVSVEHAKAMITASPDWGLGFGVRGEGDGRYFFHGGSNPGGYNALVFYFPAKGVGAAITTNGERGGALVDEMARAISNEFDLGMLAPRLVKAVDLDRRSLQRLVGRYQYRAEGEYFLDVSMDERGRLTLHDPNDGKTNTFVPTSPSTFVDLADGADAEFMFDPEGAVDFVSYKGEYVFHRVK